ncbi:MAG: NAD(P)H-hydrate dehydratase [Clostridia bacterium]|nr:NAD(P)H-hydrate dehydratase [Clostridia bacterium]
MGTRFILDYSKAKDLLPKRPVDGNKGTFGRVLIIAGSTKMVGCCDLAVRGALRCGAGLVTIAFPDSIYVPLASRLTENTFLPLPSKNGKISIEALPVILNESQKCDAVVFGCGVGLSNDIRTLVSELVLKCKKPLILDADGLNALVENIDILKYAKCDILLTPHPGEMSRLITKDVSFVEKNREKVITVFSKKYNVNVLLKGHNTLICNSDGTLLCENKSGNTGLAKGGSGDLLSGMIVGLTPALGGNLYQAACLGAYIHGLTAELVSSRFTEYSTLPSDCADNIGYIIKAILESE